MAKQAGGQILMHDPACMSLWLSLHCAGTHSWHLQAKAHNISQQEGPAKNAMSFAAFPSSYQHILLEGLQLLHWGLLVQ